MEKPIRYTASPKIGRRQTSSSAFGPRYYTAGGRPPAPDVRDEPPIRVTVYLTAGQARRLRAEAAHRQAEGYRCDVSMLLREAVEKAYKARRGQ